MQNSSLFCHFSLTDLNFLCHFQVDEFSAVNTFVHAIINETGTVSPITMTPSATPVATPVPTPSAAPATSSTSTSTMTTSEKPKEGVQDEDPKVSKL